MKSVRYRGMLLQNVGLSWYLPMPWVGILGQLYLGSSFAEAKRKLAVEFPK